MEIIFIIGTVLGAVISILWILMPFAVFGIKSKFDSLTQRVDYLGQRIDVMTRQLAETNQLLRAGFNLPDDQ